MQFNHELYHETSAKVRAEVAAGDAAWRETINERYARFLLRQVRNNLDRLDASLDAHTTADGKKLNEYAATVLESAARNCQIAALLIASKLAVADAIDSEVLIRTIETMTTTPGEKTDGPSAPVLRVRPPARAPAGGVKAVRSPGGPSRRNPPKKPGANRRPS